MNLNNLKRERRRERTGGIDCNPRICGIAPVNI